MRKVLLPVDGSEFSDHATRYVIDHAKQHGSPEIHLLNVEPAPDKSQTHGMAQDAIEAQLHATANRAMQSAHHMLKEAGLPHHVHIELGEAAETIVAMASKLNCDTIVMSTRGLGAIAGMLLGSVAQEVLRRSAVPVLCVK